MAYIDMGPATVGFSPLVMFVLGLYIGIDTKNIRAYAAGSKRFITGTLVRTQLATNNAVVQSGSQPISLPRLPRPAPLKRRLLYS